MTPQTLREKDDLFNTWIARLCDARHLGADLFSLQVIAALESVWVAAAALPEKCPSCQSPSRSTVLDVELDGRPGTRRPCPHPWHDATAQAREASEQLPERPRDRYHWGEEMPQYAALGIGPEAWADLTLEERKARDANYRDNVPVSLKWSTLRVVMAALRAIRLVDFRQAGEAAAPASPAEPRWRVSPEYTLGGHGTSDVAETGLAAAVRAGTRLSPTGRVTVQSIESAERQREAVVRPRAESTPPEQGKCAQEHKNCAAAPADAPPRCEALMPSESTGGAIRECGAIIRGDRCLNGHRVTVPADAPTYADLPDLMQAGRWEDATRLLIAKVDALYTAAHADAPGAQDETFPIPLNDYQKRAIEQWAADDRLWTTQETVAINLRTFARTILATSERWRGEAASAPTQEKEQDPSTRVDNL